MTIHSTALTTRSSQPFSIGMITCLILLINVSFKIIDLHGLVFTANSVLCPLVATLYLFFLKECNLLQQRHILNQSLLAIYLFSIGIYLLVNLPAAEYMHDNPAYQIVFEDIPKKFFAITIAFGLSFYLPHLFCCSKWTAVLVSPLQRLILALLGGFSFFCLDFLLLFSAPTVHSFRQIGLDSLMITSVILLSAGVIYLGCLLYPKSPKTIKPLPAYLQSTLYHYLVAFSAAILLISLACEYRLISFSNGFTIAASGLLFPLTLSVSNLIGELYGYRANLRLTAALMVTQLAFDLILMGIVVLPSPDFFNLNPFYSFIIPRRIPAGTLALLATFISNALLLEYLKRPSFCLHRGWRMLIANVIASALLCLVNYSLLFAGIYPYDQIFNLVLNAGAYKLCVSLLSIPLVLWLLNGLQKRAFRPSHYPMKASKNARLP